MTDNKKYLIALSEVMKEAEPAEDSLMEIFNALYAAVNEELYNNIGSSLFPGGPKLIGRLNKCLDSMEKLLLCREIANKPVFLISSKIPSKLFRFFLNIMFDENYASIAENNCYIPFIVCNSRNFKIEAVNFANERKEVSFEQYKLLIEGSQNNHIALNKIIQIFIVGLPLKNKDICLIFDNSYHDASLLLKRFLTKSFLMYNPTEKTYDISKSADYYDGVLFLDKQRERLNGDNRFDGLKKLNIRDFYTLTTRESQIPVYGFLDEIYEIQAEYISFFRKEIKQSGDLIRALTEDIVKLGEDENVNQFKKIKNERTESLKTLREEFNKYNKIYFNINELCRKISSEFSDKLSPDKLISQRTLNCIFNRLFIYSEAEIYDEAERVLERLRLFNYSGIGMAEEYIRCLKAGRNNNCYLNRVLYPHEWEKAKFIIGMTSEENLLADKITDDLKIIDSYHKLTTGKEYYTKAIRENESSRLHLLKLSFEKGYLPAASRLVDLYRQGEKINITYLANSLVPEACMLLAEEAVQNNTKLKLSSPKMFYYKLAAAAGYLPAVEAIADLIYNESFSSGYQIADSQKGEIRFQNLYYEGTQLIALCDYLIERNYRTEHFREVKGVTIFSLNTDLSEAMRLLGGIDSPIADYCKGNMYEFGGGTTIDLDSAILYYKKAGNFEKAKARLEKAKKKKEEDDKKKNESKAKTYSSDLSYKPPITPIATINSPQPKKTKKSWCFITTAVCKSINAGDDCKELNTLRWFRDNYIKKTELGELIVYEYYRIAPDIVECIDLTQNPEKEYAALWNNYIKPSYNEILNKNFEKAKVIYIDMVKSLCNKFGIEINSRVVNLI